MNQIKKELEGILEQQRQRGLRQWMIACSLIASGCTEKETGVILGCNSRTVHSMKTRPVKREVKNYLVMSASTRSRFNNLIRQVKEM